MPAVGLEVTRQQVHWAWVPPELSALSQTSPLRCLWSAIPIAYAAAEVQRAEMTVQPSDKSPQISPFISGIFLTPAGPSKKCENQMLIFTIQVWITSWWPSQNRKVAGDCWSRTVHVNIAGSDGMNGPQEWKRAGLGCCYTTVAITLTSCYQAQEPRPAWPEGQ